jgi:hypothetical protein
MHVMGAGDVAAPPSIALQLSSGVLVVARLRAQHHSECRSQLNAGVSPLNDQRAIDLHVGEAAGRCDRSADSGTSSRAKSTDSPALPTAPREAWSRHRLKPAPRRPTGTRRILVSFPD